VIADADFLNVGSGGQPNAAGEGNLGVLLAELDALER
jgi:hypothetical protein